MNITAGRYKGQKITAPDESITRPTLSKVRMGIFNTLQSMIDFEGKSFLDMYAGSGIMALEALSRGFENVLAIEKNPKVISVIKGNYKKFSPSPKLIAGDSIKKAPVLDCKFDVIFIDPPYMSGIYEESLNAVRDITSGIIIIEHTENVDFSGYNLLKRKSYGEKIITFLKI